MKPLALIITNEHAVNYIPPAYEHYFEGHEALVQTHRGIDYGTQTIATCLTTSLGCKLATATVSRLLIDLNRSLSHPCCFSEISAHFSEEEKNHLIARYYLPYREQVERDICALVTEGHQVLHLSMHSFTPILKGEIRNTDIGLLYDPKRHGEKTLARRWHYLLKQHSNSLRIRMNYPYKGNTDSLTTSLRKKFPIEDYLGIEVESNQTLTRDPHALTILIHAFDTTLKLLLKENFSDV